jgi:nitrogen regulatory protein PII-like uncharacterized protein
MTRDDIIRMAREAGIEHHENVDEMRSPFCDGVWFEDLEHFAALVAAAEREECAKEVEAEICDEIEDEAYHILVELLKRIRARGEHG